jgi:hypothetical protein
MSDERLNPDTPVLSEEENEDIMPAAGHDRQDAEKAISLHKEIYMLMHASENNGRWSGFVGGLGTGILSTLAVIGSLFLASKRRNSSS